MEASVLGAVGSYLFPSRTQQSSPPAPKILGTSVPGKIGQGRDLKTPTRKRRGLLFFTGYEARSGAPARNRARPEARPTQAPVELIGMVEHPAIAMCRIPPDPVQFQVMLGSLLGDGQLVGLPRRRRLRIAHRAERHAYVLWKYERLGPLSAGAPEARE